MSFNVGDRVEYIGDVKRFLNNKFGTIIFVDDIELMTLVEFDNEHLGLHNGSSICRGKPGHCWWFNLDLNLGSLKLKVLNKKPIDQLNNNPICLKIISMKEKRRSKGYVF